MQSELEELDQELWDHGRAARNHPHLTQSRWSPIQAQAQYDAFVCNVLGFNRWFAADDQPVDECIEDLWDLANLEEDYRRRDQQRPQQAPAPYSSAVTDQARPPKPTRLTLEQVADRLPAVAFTSGQLARRLGMSRPAASNHLKRLLAAGLIVTTGSTQTGRGKPGRPATTYRRREGSQPPTSSSAA